MAHQSDIVTEKYRQWVKAGLGLKYLNEGLAPFCKDVSEQQHRDILDNIKRVKNVPFVMCGTCTLKTLQPDHVNLGNEQCPYGRPFCNCLFTSGKFPCPNNVCGAIYDRIIHYHASTPPAPKWKNTQTQQWTADPWSISKCFINAPGYGQKTSAADTDCTGLLRLIINNKYFHNHVSCKMKGPNMFSKVGQYRNEIFHTSTWGLDSKKTNSYIDDMIAVLQDGKELIHRQDAQQAVKKLQDLKNKDLVITMVDKGLGDIGENIGSNKLAMEEHKEDSEEEQIAKYETLESKSMKTAASQVKSRNNWVHLFRLLTLTIDEGTTIVRNIFDEKRLNVPLDVFLAQHRHDIKQLRKTKTITQSQYDLLFPQIGTPATTDFDFTLTICLLRNLKPFGLNQHFAWNALPQPGDTSLEADLLRLKIIRNELTNIPASTGISEQDFKSKWSDIENVYLRLNASLQNPDVNLHQRIDECKNKPFDPGALKGIEQSIDNLQTLINSEVESLRTDVDNLTSKSDDINKEMETLKTNQEKRKSCEGSEWTTCIKNEDIEQANQLLEMGQLPDAGLLNRACQKFGLKSALLKVICTKIEEKITASSDCIIYTNACYKETDLGEIVFVVITGGATDYVDLSKEEYIVHVRSIDNCSLETRMVIDKEMGLRFVDTDLEALEIVLKERSPNLMANHSNLTLTSGSMFKSQYKGARKISVERKDCIVFYVTVKGLIPVGEDLLPKRLGQFDTDVREGRFGFAVGGQPGVKHKHLKLGCRISCKDGAGTIGGFVQHPEFGVCALTCAHVVLSKEEVLGVRKKNDENPGIGKECFQPNYNENGENKCGTIVAVHMKEGKSNNEGVDAALVKIDDDRLPTNGHFPDCDLSDIKGGCSHCKDNLVRKSPSFKKGTVLDTDEITTDYNVVKYGQKTKFTIGTLKVKGGSVRFEHCLDINKEKQTKDNKKRYQFTLHNLLEIQSMGSPFAEAGDSGALVLSQDNNNKLAAFGLLVGYDSATSITLVQPICSVLKHLELRKPYSLMNFDPRERRIDQLEKSVNDIGTILQKISKQLDRERR